MSAWTTGDVITQSRLRNLPFTAYVEHSTIPAIVAGVLTLDLLLGNHFGPVLFNANITTLTINNIAASGDLSTFCLALKMDGSARTLASPASWKWPFATAPVFSGTNNQIDEIYGKTDDGGTTVRVTYIQGF